MLQLRRYKPKRVKTRCYQKRVGHLEPKFQEEGVVPGEYFLVCTKLDTFCYLTVQTAQSDSVIERAVVLTQYRRVTDGQTEGRTELS